MRWIVEWSLRTKSLVLGVAGLVFLFGLLSLRQVTVDTLPEFSATYVEIQTEALGLSAAEVEQLITLGLEADLLNGVPWLQTIQSKSIDGLSSIRLVFEPGTDLMTARQMVQERLTQAKALPNVSLPPTMLPPLSSTSKVMAIGMTSDDLSTVQLSVLARWTVGPRLMGVPGVANVSVWGLRDRELQVQVDPLELRIRGTNLDEVVKSTGEALWESPLSYLEASTPGTGGWVDTPNQRLGVRHVSPIIKSADLAKVTFKDSNGALHTLDQVADVKEDHQPLIGDAIINGRPGLLLVVEKFPWSNTLEITRGVDAALAALKPGLPGVMIDAHIFRPASFIETSLDNLSWALLAGCILVIVVLFALLYEWRLALISLIAISLSLVAAVLVLCLLKAAVNVMVLAGLLIALGAVVDDAIIDIENIVQRIREHRITGDTRSVAAVILEASLEVRSPLIYATLIALLAVMPVFFMTGLAGAFFRPLVISYSVALLASLVVALTVTPVLSLVLLDRVPWGRQSPAALWLARRHEAALTRIVHRPSLAYVAVGVLILAAIAVSPMLGRSLLPEFKERDVLIRWETPPGTSMPEMTRITTRASDELRSIPGVATIASSLGRAVTSQSIPGPYEGALWVSIDPTADYDATMARINEIADDYPGIVHDVETYLQGSIKQRLAETPDQITVRVYGLEEPILREKALEIAALVKRIPGVTSALIAPRLEAPSIEIETDLTKARKYGLKPGDVRRAASALLGRIQVGSLFQDQKVFNVVVWGKPETRQSLTDISQLSIDTPDGGSVRLGDVASVRIKPSELVISRDAVSRYVDVGVTMRPGEAGSVQKQIEQSLSQVKLPLEYHVELQVGSGTWGDARWRVLGPIIAAVALIFLFLQAALSSWRLAIVVFVTLPAALVGGVLVAGLGGSAMSLVTLTGLLAVFAVTVRNAIAVLRRAQEAETAERSEGGWVNMLHGTRDLVAPILTSTVVTAGALLPFVLAGHTPGLEILHALAGVILGGLISSTVVTLFILPVICANLNYRAEPDPLLE